MEARSLVFNRVSKELIGIALIAMFLFLLFFVDFTSLANLHKNMPQEWLNVNTVFLSIIFEAIPFILLGVIVSSFIQVFVTEDMIQKVMPKSPIVAMIPAVFVGVLFPMCHYTNCKKAHSKGVTTSCRHCYFTECTHYESSCSFIYCICVSKK